MKTAIKKETVNLCDTCVHQIPTCTGVPKFGTGKGNDNVYECTGYTKPTKTAKDVKSEIMGFQSTRRTMFFETNSIFYKSLKKPLLIISEEELESYANEVSREKFAKFMYATHTATHAKKIIGLYNEWDN